MSQYRFFLQLATLAFVLPFSVWASDFPDVPQTPGTVRSGLTKVSNVNPQAPTWKMIDENEVSATYVDTSTNRDIGNSIRRIRTLINFKKRFGKAMSSITVDEFDCMSKSVRFVKIEGFTESYGQGSIIGTTLPQDLGMVPGQFSPVEQEDISSPIRQQFDLACGKP